MVHGITLMVENVVIMPERQSTPSQFVFVYGTLRRGEVNDINRLHPAPRCLGQAQVLGHLYQLGYYPGLVLGGTQAVVGEVYAIDAALEPQLDRIEGISADTSQREQDEYQKRLLPVHLDGQTLTCLLYEVNPLRVAGCPRIVSGDWCCRHGEAPASVGV